MSDEQSASMETENKAGVNDAAFASLREENERMKAKLDELLSETKKAKEAKRQAEVDAQKAAEDKAKSENDFEQLFNSAQERIKTLESEKQLTAETLKQDRIRSEAMKLASGLTKDTSKAELLAEKISQRLSVNEDGVKVLDESGNLTISSIDDLMGSVKERYAFLVDAGSSGGGATGANSGAVKPSKKFNEYSGAELSEIRKSDPETYQRLKTDYYGA